LKERRNKGKKEELYAEIPTSLKYFLKRNQIYP